MIRIGRKGTTRLLGSIFEDLQKKRLESLASNTVGTMLAAGSPIHAIGASYAALAKIAPKHGVKQVDRYLRNMGINIEEPLPQWAAFVFGDREEVINALDWTEFVDEDHATLAAYVTMQVLHH